MKTGNNTISDPQFFGWLDLMVYLHNVMTVTYQKKKHNVMTADNSSVAGSDF